LVLHGDKDLILNDWLPKIDWFWLKLSWLNILCKSELNSKFESKDWKLKILASSYNQLWSQNQFYSRATKHVKINYIALESILTPLRVEANIYLLADGFE
jgi:hypothetical protein